jgi:Fur family ferric uptake transcriptional regulator
MARRPAGRPPRVAERDQQRREVIGLLSNRRVRLTRPRTVVLEALLAGDTPLSVADIHGRLGDARVNLVSVYRTINLLLRLGVVRVADAARGIQRYELAEPFAGHHHHLICQACGSIEDLEGCLLEPGTLAALCRGVRRSRRFRVTGHDVSLLGVCGACAAGRALSEPEFPPHREMGYSFGAWRS